MISKIAPLKSQRAFLLSMIRISGQVSRIYSHFEKFCLTICLVEIEFLSHNFIILAKATHIIYCQTFQNETYQHQKNPFTR